MDPPPTHPQPYTPQSELPSRSRTAQKPEQNAAQWFKENYVDKGIGRFVTVPEVAMGGVDAIVFGGGIGRKSSRIRAMALEGLDCLGAKLHEGKNLNPSGGDDISTEDSKVRIYVVDTNEEIIVARKAKALLESN